MCQYCNVNDHVPNINNLLRIYNAILRGDMVEALHSTQQASDEGVEPELIINHCIKKAMTEAERQFSSKNISTPQLLMSRQVGEKSLEMLVSAL